MALQAPEIDEGLVRALVADQFPQWTGLAVRCMPHSGWDNRTFLLGQSMLVRLPSACGYAAQPHREQRCLPYLRAHLPIEIPEPLALGRPGHGYAWSWSVYRWIVGDTAANAPPNDVGQFAEDLASFLNALRGVSAEGGPEPGSDNFYRGGKLAVYDEQARQAIATLGGQIDSATALSVWEAALATTWSGSPVWVHGDVALGNLLMRGGRLAAVIDFGQVCVGDPACDLAIAWTYFRAEDRRAFRARLALDSSTWQRGRAWALWKALVVAAGLVGTRAVEGQHAWQTIDEVLGDEAACRKTQTK